MMWTDTPCRITCWNCGNETIIAERDPKIEFILAQHPWLENDCLYADIILPSNTNMEVDDIVTNTRQGTQHHSVILMNKAIEPIGESKSDYEVVLEIAKKMGKEKEFRRQDRPRSAKRGLQEHEPRKAGQLG
jgi:anaerobic selenocysteine-containing dehydrogenase